MRALKVRSMQYIDLLSDLAYGAAIGGALGLTGTGAPDWSGGLAGRHQHRLHTIGLRRILGRALAESEPRNNS